MIKQQSVLRQDKKGSRRQIKMSDLPPKRNQKGGSSGKIVGSENGNSAIPTSLQEFLSRDSLSINSNWFHPNLEARAVNASPARTALTNLGHDSACPSRKYSTARRAPLTVSGTSQAYRPGKRCRRKRYLLLYFHSWLLGFQISL
jgi:hypothetical protein